MQIPTLPKVGDTIAGKYRIERVLGEGGMGIVYQAVHAELLQPAALKVLLPHIANHQTAAERFRREARAAAAMRGDHVCRVLDVGTLDGSLPYMVMEYLEGQDLAEELRQRGPLPSAEAVDYILQACEALAEAHGANIVHRDLKPANLFLTRRADDTRCIKVLDFGVSKALTDSESGALDLTNTATMVGSPLYMSPEQLDSARNVDVRTDIWALGVVLYELLSAHPPFGGASIPQLVSSILHEKPKSMSERGISAPAGLERIMGRAMAKDREQRFVSVVEFAEALILFGTVSSDQAASRAARVFSASAAATDPGLQKSGEQRLTTTQMSASHPDSGPKGWSASRNSGADSGDRTPLGWQRTEAVPDRTKRYGRFMPWAIPTAALLLGGYLYVQTQLMGDPPVPTPASGAGNPLTSDDNTPFKDNSAGKTAGPLTAGSGSGPVVEEPTDDDGDSDGDGQSQPVAEIDGEAESTPRPAPAPTEQRPSAEASPEPGPTEATASGPAKTAPPKAVARKKPPVTPQKAAIPPDSAPAASEEVADRAETEEVAPDPAEPTSKNLPITDFGGRR